MAKKTLKDFSKAYDNLLQYKLPKIHTYITGNLMESNYKCDVPNNYAIN